MKHLALQLLFCFLIIFTSNAQNDILNSKVYELDSSSSLLSRIGETPSKILDRFRDAGMNPSRHTLTREEHKIVSSALNELPPLHQRVLKKHLLRISFLDNMPNTAFTAPISPNDSIKLYAITVRAEILNQTVSEWLTEKERNCFDFSNTNLNVSIRAGELSAILYVLIHEATHIVDGALNLTPQYTVPQREIENSLKSNPFTANIWKNRIEPIEIFQNKMLDEIYFKSRKKMPINKSQEIYGALKNSPFVSLYGRNSYHEDLAEIATIYHFTKKLKQEYQIVIAKGNSKLFSYEPMKSMLVKNRLPQLEYFYL
ncbi:hypothetical protein WIW50_15640 [Flavobacteriaceae bacterium 3-367]|uniref:hypothetical protein n=1 Tax=Eudoraea algarum TaxID=3417568 RepID=UPI00326CD4B0